MVEQIAVVLPAEASSDQEHEVWRALAEPGRVLGAVRRRARRRRLGARGMRRVCG
nr:hypothetical protein [Angustibacter aerolatus]